MTLIEQLDADLRARLRRGRALPPKMADVMAGPLPVPSPRVLAARVNPFLSAAAARFAVTPIISEKIIRRVDKLGVGVAALRQSLEASSVTAENIERAVELLAGLAVKKRTVSLERILGVTADAFGVTESEIVGPSRVQSVTWPRFAFCLLAKRHAGISSTKLGYFLGLRDHTSILNAWRRAEKLMAENETWRAKYDAAELLICPVSEMAIVCPQASEL